MSSFAYYPGCSLSSSAVEYDKSIRAVFAKLEHELIEIEDWICCGASPAHQTDAALSAELAAYNVLLAADQGMDMIVPCAACFNRLKAGQHKLTSDDLFRQRVESEYGIKYAPIEIMTPVGVLAEAANLEIIRALVGERESRMPLVSYYGCLLVRPPKLMQFDDPEYPVTMDTVLSAAGYETLAWDFKTECCGGSLALGHRDSVMRLTRRILKAAVKSGAAGIAVACPLCHQNLDARQSQINKVFKEKMSIPVYYFSELLAVALGFDPRQIGVDKHAIEAVSVLGKGR